MVNAVADVRLPDIMTIDRHFLDWSAPVTERLRTFLLPANLSPALHADARLIDLSDTLIIVPTRHAARRLSETLVRHAAERGCGLLAPSIVPPALLLQPAEPDPRVADPTRELATWIAVLEDAEPQDYAALLPARRDTQDTRWAIQTAAQILRLRQALAEGALLIRDVTRKFMDQLEEIDRWNDLAALESLYLERLDQAGYRDALAAQIAYSANPVPAPAVKRIVVASVPDLSGALVATLDALASQVRVDIVVHAPSELADTFDAWGRPLPDQWSKRAIPLPDSPDTIRVAESPAAQSRIVTAILTGDGGSPPDPAAVGVPDREIIAPLLTDLESNGLSAFDPSDRPVAPHPLFTLLDGLAAIAGERSYEALRSLIRHPDLLGRLQRSGRADHGAPSAALLESLDRFQNDWLPNDWDDVVDALQRARTGSSRSTELASLERAAAFIAHPLERLAHDPAEVVLRDFLRDVYAGRQIDARVPADVAFTAVAGKLDTALRELAEISAGTRNVDGARALDLLRMRMADETYHPFATTTQFALEGWLELPWNDAQRLVIAGMNEGCVPDTRRTDPFLPDSLRVRLGLRHDAERLARDAFLLSSMLAWRTGPGMVTLIVGKFSAAGDPLKPSRLLFRCDDEALPARAAALFGPAASARNSVAATVSFRLASRPPGATPQLPRKLSVTAFRDYLTCPFRFYLGRVLNMKRLSDDKAGMDALDFGSLVHAAMDAMAESGMWRCDDERALRAYLADQARAWVARRHGPDPSLPVALALEAASERLGAAARLQVETHEAGWELVAHEERYTRTIGGVEIIGRIDRIDRHRDTGRMRILDYKTTDVLTKPEAAHLASRADNVPAVRCLPGDKPRRWIDLQLPLYVFLTEIDPGNVDLGYFSLPKAVTDTVVESWPDFNRNILRSAVDCAGSVVADICAGRFWPPAEKVRHDDFAGLLPAGAEASFEPLSSTPPETPSCEVQS